MVLRTASIAILVLPAPVGAATNIFSLVWKAIGNTMDWTLFKFLMPLNAFCENGSNEDIGINFSSSLSGAFCTIGIIISS